MNKDKTRMPEDRAVGAYLDGILQYFATPQPKYPANQLYLMFGWMAGQWIIGWYLAEVLIKRRLDSLKIRYGKNHNLLDLFDKLPLDDRNSIESMLKETNNKKPIHGYDHPSARELLQFLSKKDITKFRYFWEYGDDLDIPIAKLKRLVGILFVAIKVK